MWCVLLCVNVLLGVAWDDPMGGALCIPQRLPLTGKNTRYVYRYVST